VKHYTLYQIERGREKRFADFEAENDVWALHKARALARGHLAELRSDERLVSILNA
jgi:hypothetical protein